MANSHSGLKQLLEYRFFVLINNGMRGPFVEAGSPASSLHWTQPFTSLINEEASLRKPVRITKFLLCSQRNFSSDKHMHSSISRPSRLSLTVTVSTTIKNKQ